ncbi:hypothetical protein [Marinomonas mediterranea]|uniref:hypothetical protein n=1 Tax=Marinomonas mediterranea TaxID=119864 RepID=UPI002349E893|nr:hypothetical protein [Marinomonas mediterranea]WCN09185.1 hypothetical protein GV055_09740 [Marinomonas mediterranea]WCN13268.1 hypothetical protein GV054_09750 [Marinomonas mediterranea]
MQRDDEVEIPSLTLDQDELQSRNPQPSKPKRKLNPPPAKPTSSATQAKAPVYKKQSLAGVYFLLLLILGAASSAGYWLWQQNQQLKSQLAGALNEIQDLDHQLIAADVSAGKLGSTVEETLKTHESEIRKLWGVAYDRNRKNIQTNVDSLKSTQSKLAELRENVATQGKLVAVQGDTFNEIEDGYNRLVESVSALDKKADEELSSLQLSVQAVQLQGEQVSGKQSNLQAQYEALGLQINQALANIDALSKKVESNKTEISEVAVTAAAANAKPTQAAPTVKPEALAKLDKQVADNNEAIASIDVFRSQVLSQLNTLKAQVNQLALQQQLSGDEGL